MFIDACPIAKEPFGHQLERWRKQRDKIFWANFWEQGTGKSCKMMMDAAWLYSRGEIDAMLVLAPNGVHRNWITDEVPTHWPTELGAPGVCWYRSKSSEAKYHQREVQACINSPGFAVLAMSYDALDTEDKQPKLGVRDEVVLGGRSWIKEFLARRKGVLVVADEASRIKGHDTWRTIRSCQVAEMVKYRRIANGTPVANSPFDLYAQVCFLDPKIGPRGGLQSNFWISKGITSFQGFKTQFGVWGTGYRWGVDKKTKERKKIPFPELQGFKNLELLHEWLDEISDRITKEDAGLNLPEKLYKTMRFDLTDAQRRVYDALKEESIAFLEGGELITTPLVLTKMLRLQQVCQGYVSVDDPEGEPIIDIGKENPRLDLLGEICEDLPHKAIIWTRFKRDVDLILDRLKEMDRKAVRYDGQVNDEDRRKNVLAFQKGDAQFFVSNPVAGGEGLTLLGDQSEGAAEELACKTVIYYGNNFSLQNRLQSEDRAHRIGQRWPVQYIDICASDTLDDQIASNLKNKFNIAQQVTGDKFRQWIA
jgi:SNF2 family DNA or RNA helicase